MSSRGAEMFRVLLKYAAGESGVRTGSVSDWVVAELFIKEVNRSLLLRVLTLNFESCLRVRVSARSSAS